MRAAGLQLRRLTGRELTSRDWDSFYDFYINTTGATSSSDFRMQTAFSDAPRTFTIARLRNAYRSLERCQEHQKQSSVHRLPRAVPDMRGAQIFCCERGLAGIGPHGTSQPKCHTQSAIEHHQLPVCDTRIASHYRCSIGQCRWLM